VNISALDNCQARRERVRLSAPQALKSNVSASFVLR
jgi:hypothetical protein